MPPGRKSILHDAILKPFGPHQCIRCSHSVNAFHTRSRGASKTREITNSFTAAAASFLAATFLLLRLQRTQIVVEPVETRFPEAAVLLEPVVDAVQRRRLDAGGTPLRVAASRDQAGALQHL